MTSGVYERKPMSEETKRKIGDGNRGKIVSEETRKKISGKNNGMYGRTGEKHPNYGKHLSKEHRKKIKESMEKVWQDSKHRKNISNKISGKNNGMYGRTEEKHWNWNPNRSEVYAPYGVNFYDKTLRKEKYELQRGRDMLTGTKLDSNKYPHYHHIDYVKSNDDPDNHCFVSNSNHMRITGCQKNLIKSEKYKQILQENTQDLQSGLIPRRWSPLNKELFRQENSKQLNLSSCII